MSFLVVLFKRAAALVGLGVITATGAFAALSAPYATWGDGPAAFLMTRGEKSAWKRVKTDDQAIAFIDLFWARRDPTPELRSTNSRLSSRAVWRTPTQHSRRKHGVDP